MYTTSEHRSGNISLVSIIETCIWNIFLGRGWIVDRQQHNQPCLYFSEIYFRKYMFACCTYKYALTHIYQHLSAEYTLNFTTAHHPLRIYLLISVFKILTFQYSPCLSLPWRVWRMVCQKQNQAATNSEYVSNIFSQSPCKYFEIRYVFFS